MDGLKYDICKEEECIQFFKESFLMTIRKEHFNKPTTEFVFSVYEKFLYDFGVAFSIPHLNNFCNDSHIYGDGFSLMNRFKATKILLDQTGFEEFSFGDLFAPKRKRTLIIFSQLIGLWIDYFSNQENWQRIQVNYQDLPAKKMKLRKEVSDLKETLSSQSIIISELRDKFKLMEKQVEQKVTEFNREKEVSENLKITKNEIKAKQTQEEQKLKNLLDEITRLQVKIETLESRLVFSPETVLKETDIKNAQLDDKRIEKRLLEKEYSNALRELNLLSDTTKELVPNLKTIDDIASDIDILKKSCLHLEKLKEEVDSFAKKIDEMKVVLQSLQNRKDKIIKQKKAASKIHKQKLEPIVEMINSMKSTIETLKKEKSAKESNIVKEINIINNQLEAIKENSKEIVTEFNDFESSFKGVLSNCTQVIKSKFNIQQSTNKI